MWPKYYKDYKVDTPLRQAPLETGKGIIGCEMHEINGWGEHYHHKPMPKYKGRLTSTNPQIHLEK